MRWEWVGEDPTEERKGSISPLNKNLRPSHHQLRALLRCLSVCSPFLSFWKDFVELRRQKKKNVCVSTLISFYPVSFLFFPSLVMKKKIRIWLLSMWEWRRGEKSSRDAEKQFNPQFLMIRCSKKNLLITWGQSNQENKNSLNGWQEGKVERLWRRGL